MANEKKFITCDGNYAAAHIAYLFSENVVTVTMPLPISLIFSARMQPSTRSPRRRLWQNMSMSGLPRGRKTFSER